MKNRRRHQPVTRKQPNTARSTAGPAELVHIEKAIYGGSFLSRVEGKAVFVPLALPGETARVRITEEKRGYATAEVAQIVTPAGERAVPACLHFGTCGGCQYQHSDYRTQLALKQAILRETLERGGVPAPEKIDVLAGTEAEAWVYRNRIRLAFDAKGSPGYRSRRSNAVVPIAECPIAAPLLVRAAFAFAEITRQFAPQLHVEELSLFCDGTESALLASAFVRSASSRVVDALAHAMVERIPELKGLELASAVAKQTNLQAPRTIARWGDTHLIYRAEFDYRVDHGAFFQVNRHLLDALVERVTASRAGTLAWDLFAGVGLFARKLTESFDRVTAVESATASIPGLEANLRGTSGVASHAWTLDFLRGKAKREHPDLIIVDPPRAGLGAEITAELIKISAPAVTYISCDPATLARDLRVLLTSGYTIDSVMLVDLFPQTYHLETVVHLRRT